MLRLAIVNGPNLNLVGTREQDIYGNKNIEEYLQELKEEYKNVALSYFQSNVEGEIINHLHSLRGKIDGIVFNGGGYSHTSIAIADAIAAIDIPVVEVHISNIHAREAFREHSYTAAKSIGCITGLGLKGYALAVQYFVDTLSAKTS